MKYLNTRTDVFSICIVEKFDRQQQARSCRERKRYISYKQHYTTNAYGYFTKRFNDGLEKYQQHLMEIVSLLPIHVLTITYQQYTFDSLC